MGGKKVQNKREKPNAKIGEQRKVGKSVGK